MTCPRRSEEGPVLHPVGPPPRAGLRYPRYSSVRVTRLPVRTGTRAEQLSPGHAVPGRPRRHAGNSAQAGLASNEERGIKRDDAGQGDSHTSHASPLAAIGIACQRLGPVSGGAVNLD